MKNIVIIGGGTGTFTLLSGLRKFPTNNSVIVSTADDGGSTGRLREELGVIPPGDIRQCLVGLSYTDEILRKLFSYRFERGSLKGHALGNIIIAALEKITGGIEKSIIEAAKLLNVRGQVVPVTLFPTKLTAILEDGKKIFGEHFIDEPRHSGRLKIKGLRLSPNYPANPRALRLIREAHAIIFGPGDLFTSTLPNLLVKGTVEAIKKSKAQKILITNIMTKYGQTNRFKASDFIEVLQKYLGREGLDAAIVNTHKPKTKFLRAYHKQKSLFVEPDLETVKKMGVKVVAKPMISTKTYIRNRADVLQRSLLRHDSDKLAGMIYSILS